MASIAHPSIARQSIAHQGHPNSRRVPLDPDTLKSTKFPGDTVTFPDAVHADPDATEQASVVFAMLPGVPCRSVTVIVPD
jgi:hypothetical protein